MMQFLYAVGIRLYGLGIHLAAPFSLKARQWTQGRARWLEKAEKLLSGIDAGEKDWIWMHCSSLGEFEQGRPVLEGIKEKEPDRPLLLTFFSPSGYEIRKDYPHADLVLYLPLDTPSHAKALVELFQPRLAIFVKYDLWHYYLKALDEKGIPSVLISALFRPGQVYFKWYGGFFRAMLRRIDHFFLQEQASADLLDSIGLANYSVTGDTRIDRVVQLARQRKSFPEIEGFAGDSPVLVAGSPWSPDLDVLAPFFNQHLPTGWKVIVAPHEIKEKNLRELEQRVKLRALRYSKLKQGAFDPEARMLIIDNIGMLSALYAYGRVAYIGGGFNPSGIHNTLEPAVFGLPVFFGPNYRKFREAVELARREAAFPVRTAVELERGFTPLLEQENRARASRAALEYVRENEGATRAILDRFREAGWWVPTGNLPIQQDTP